MSLVDFGTLWTVLMWTTVAGCLVAMVWEVLR